MKKIIFVLILFFVVSCSEKEIEKIENNLKIESEKSIIIWKNTENLVDSEEKISIKDFLKKVNIDYKNWLLKLKSIEDENFLKNLKIRKLENFPWNIKIDLNQKISCKENEINNWNFCVDKSFLEDYKKRHEEKDWMWPFPKEKCFKNFEFCDEKIYKYFSDETYTSLLDTWFWEEQDYEEYFWFKKEDINISLNLYQNILIINFYEKQKYLTSEIFFVNSGRWKTFLWNLENKNVLRIFETLKFPSDNDFVIDFSNDKNFLSKKAEKISFEDLQKLDFIIEWWKNLILEKNYNYWFENEKKSFLKDLKIEEVSIFPHNLDIDFERNPNCRNGEKLSKNFYCYKIWDKPLVEWEEVWLESVDLYNKNIYSSIDFFNENTNKWFLYISFKTPKNLEIFLKKYKNYLIIDFYEGKKYLKSQVIYFQKDYNWYPIQFFLNLELESHRRFLETYYIPEN